MPHSNEFSHQIHWRRFRSGAMERKSEVHIGIAGVQPLPGQANFHRMTPSKFHVTLLLIVGLDAKSLQDKLIMGKFYALKNDFHKNS